MAKQIEDEIDSIKQQLESVSRELSLDIILDHQAAINAVSAEIAKHYALIEKQRQIISDANISTDTVVPLLSERESILVDIALGKDDQGKLAKLNEKIEQARANVKAATTERQKTIEQANHTITGLERLIEPLNSEREKLEKLTGFIVDKYLRAKAEQAHTEYLTKTAELKQALVTIAAIDQLVRPLSKRVSGLLPVNYGAIYPLLSNHEIEPLKIMQQIKSEFAGHGVSVPQWK